MKENIRVLLFTTAFRPFIGGSELAIENIAKRLPNVFFDILTPRYSLKLPAFERLDNVHIWRIGIGNNKDKWLFPILGVFKAMKLYRRERHALIHVYQASHAAGAALFAKFFIQNIPLILTLQEGEDFKKQSRWKKDIRNFIIRRVDYATAISEYLQHFAVSVNDKLAVQVIPNGVDFKLFSTVIDDDKRHKLRSRLGIAPDDKVIISVSRFVKKNNIETVLKAFAEVVPRFHSKLLLVGDGPLRKELKDMTERFHISDKVIFTGSVDYSVLPTYLQCADVFVRPSLSEGLGTAFLEAMAAGLPIIGPSVGGIGDFLQDGETGLFCVPLDYENIASKISDILKDDNLRSKLIHNGQELIRSKYDWNVIAEKMHTLYSATIRL